ncbi:MAG: hypothetical protein MJ201_01355 [Mycoplasmoidaceae bacterium]|nr:hypothetical protein [Mycoplasmoidaceae bacterium]
MISSSARGQGGIIDILDPYGVYKIIEKVSREVATDISFPNAYRPENNPGYKTDVTIKK